ncbi:ATP-binding protein [Metabacillus sp. GX 13764]|uniref:ATP-binding protein n=1 Tax=Metabacillus kandeliae TaxID=2900151 RepID=UPI001E3536F1|nr:ATP-binding protein [Metabacillus kandeliae]MCD7035773.1 ATP-binding protein [Metabacillus kandeliae]
MIKKSLPRQFGAFTAAIILMFCATFAIFVWAQNRTQASYDAENSRLKMQEKLAGDLDYAFNSAISEIRAYFAYGENGKNKLYYEKAMEQKSLISQKLDELHEDALAEKDSEFVKAAQAFYTFYFQDAVPKSVRLYEEGDIKGLTKVALSPDGSAKIRNFQQSLKEYRGRIAAKQAANDESFANNSLASQLIFSGAVLALLIILFAVIRHVLNKLRKPLNDLTQAAKGIAAGREVIFMRTIDREDELGLLHKAFEKMSRNIVGKEQDLNAQNEELIAQQDELQAQQSELEDALGMMRDREAQLTLRNELIHGISNTLDKGELLESIVTAMARIVGAEKGFIFTADDQHSSASYGASEKSMNLISKNSDAAARMLKTKKPFSVKRKAYGTERDGHEQELFSYDLYLPVISSENAVEAILLLTRYSDDYTSGEMDNYAGLAKNVSLSLEKISLYEQSEKDRVLNQEIMNTVHEGIQFVDVNGKILQTNEQMKTIYQHSVQGVHNRFLFSEWADWFERQMENGETAKKFFSEAVLAANTELNKTAVFQLARCQKVIQVYAEPLFQNGLKIGTVLVHRDITKEYEADQMKSEFVSTVSHELRTPLASVLGFTELMLNRELSPERQKKYLSTIYQEAKRLTLLINEFLDVQRMEAGKQPYEKRYEDLVLIVESVLENQKVQAAAHQFVLNKQTDQTVVLGDKDKIAQVFTNLISNAVKYSPEGGTVTVTISEEGKQLKIDIKDEGLGIPSEALDKLFAKFYRVDNSDRRTIGGTGLGLAIVKEIMKAHDGKVNVSSALGKGSTFTVSFPLVLGTDAGSEEERTGAAEHRTNVIIVEDDLNLANLLKTELEESRFAVKIFTGGQEALTCIKDEKPDAVVLDIMLSDASFTGWDVLTEIKKNKALSKLPIFISSALDEKEKGLALGAEDYLVKPYQPSALSKLILQTLLQKDWQGQILVPAED